MTAGREVTPSGKEDARGHRGKALITNAQRTGLRADSDMPLSMLNGGWKVSPLPPRQKHDSSWRKGDSWAERATDDLAVVAAWPEDANYLIPARMNGLVILDEDRADALRDAGVQLPPTFTVKTGKGHHFYLAADPAAPYSQASPWPGVDVRWDGYVVGPGSVHPDTGRPYRLVDDRAPAPVPPEVHAALVAAAARSEEATIQDVGEIAGLPPTVLTPTQERFVQAAVRGVLDALRALADLSERQRNEHGQGWDSGTFHAATRLLELRNAAPQLWTLDEAEHMFIENAPADGSFPPHRARAKWNAALRKVGTRPADLPADTTAEWGDAGLRSHQRMAARLETRVSGRCLYVHGAGWHYWDGKRWAPDHGNAHVHGHLEALLRDSMSEAIRDKDLLADVKSASTASGSRGVLDLAATRKGLRAEEVDSDPYLLNCANGTLDLHTLELRPADPADRITKVTAAAYDPNARGEAWTKLLAESLPDPEVRGFLQRYAGLSLIGRVQEHLLVIAVGAGRNGKGMFAFTFQKALGDYGVTASNDLLVAGRYGGKSAGELSAQMQLRGARWAVMSELNASDHLAEATMKSLTGGDVITAKLMGKDFVNFHPSHSLFMLTNHLPRVPADSRAAWARIRVVPYDVSFEGREDTTLEERLELEYDAALAWAVDGLRDYLDRGLAEPESVLARTRAYRDDNDPVARFISECCVQGPTHWVSRSDFRDAFNNWMHSQREPIFTAKALTAAMEAQGFAEGKRQGTRGWKEVAVEDE